MKFLRYVLLAAVSVLPATSRADTDYIALPILHDIQAGTDNASQIEDLRVHDDAVILDDVGIGGDLAVTGAFRSASAGSISGLKVNGQFGLSQSSLTVTSGQILVFSTSPVIKMTAGGADLTVTATIANVSASYVSNIYRVVNVGPSNGIVITDAAPVYNSGATLGITDYATYNVIATNQIIQESTSNN